MLRKLLFLTASTNRSKDMFSNSEEGKMPPLPKAIQMTRGPSAYAPPSSREQEAKLLAEIEALLHLTPLQKIAEGICLLTFGDLITMARDMLVPEGVGDDEPSRLRLHDQAMLLHKWAVANRKMDNI